MNFVVKLLSDNRKIKINPIKNDFTVQIELREQVLNIFTSKALNKTFIISNKVTSQC